MLELMSVDVVLRRLTPAPLCQLSARDSSSTLRPATASQVKLSARRKMRLIEGNAKSFRLKSY
jgi:hypothetical protein